MNIYKLDTRLKKLEAAQPENNNDVVRVVTIPDGVDKHAFLSDYKRANYVPDESLLLVVIHE